MNIVRTCVSLFFLLCIASLSAERLVLIDSVTDMSVSYPAPANEPAAPQERPCKRAHQGLFNEQVELVQEKDGFLQISYDDAVIYGIDSNNQRLSHFWISKQQAVALAHLSQELLSAVPTQKDNSIVLTLPWHGLSVGTHLVRTPGKDTGDDYAVVIPNYQTAIIHQHFVPKTHAIEYMQRSTQKSRKLFLRIVNDLINHAHKQAQVIPYVWGGSSYIHANDPDDAHHINGAWERKKQGLVYTGYDCSELIMRVAQMVGIPFPWKLSGMIHINCRPVSSSQDLENGDIIWIQGHVMIVNNIANNEVIEARGYKSGYGKIHRIKLDELFQNVHTFNDLLEIYFNKKPISLKNRKGGIVKTYDNCKLFKLL